MVVILNDDDDDNDNGNDNGNDNNDSHGKNGCRAKLIKQQNQQGHVIIIKFKNQPIDPR